MKAEPTLLVEAGGQNDNKRTFTVADQEPCYRRILIVTDNDLSAKLLSDAFKANTYDVWATSQVDDAVRFAITHNPVCVLLMLSSLDTTCNAARQLRQHTSTKIIAFSTILITEAQRDVAIRSGCDDYRYAFLQRDKRK